MFSLADSFFRHVSALRERLRGGTAEISAVRPFRRALDVFHQESLQEGRGAERQTPTLLCVCLVKRACLSLHAKSVGDSALELCNLKGTHL